MSTTVRTLRWALLAGLVLLGAQAAANDEAMVELAATSGCFICHTISKDPDVPIPLGPSYEEIATRYRDDPKAVGYLFERVKNGTQAGPQNWADKVNMQFMPPNVNVGDEDNRRLVDWILSLDDGSPTTPRLITFESMVIMATTRGCLACHAIDPSPEGSVPLAPSFREITARYENEPGATQDLIAAIRGGTLNKPKGWTNANMRFMPPSVALSAEDAQDLVAWILSLETQAP